MSKNTKILYLLPPSEGKHPENIFSVESLTYIFEKPLSIAKKATPKDLKCKDKRFQEAIELNANIGNSLTHFAISRYDGVMYKAIDYQNMSKKGQKYFEKHFLILSGMYGILSPTDKIANYKLPIETKGLLEFWGEKITQTLQNMEVDIIVDLLPNSYKKMIDFSKIDSKVYEINFVENIDGKDVKVSHNVKKMKGEFIKTMCENGGKFSFDHKEKTGKNIFVFTIKI